METCIFGNKIGQRLKEYKPSLHDSRGKDFGYSLSERIEESIETEVFQRQRKRRLSYVRFSELRFGIV